MYEMYQEYEDRIEQLNSTINELQNKIKQYSIIINEKDYQIMQLMDENSQLKAKLQQKLTYGGNITQEVNTAGNVNPPAYDVRVNITRDQVANPGLNPVLKVKSNPIPAPQTTPKPHVTPLKSATPQGAPKYKPYPSQTSQGTLKRICPNCGAMGFAIKEVEDKSNILSYVPYRIYAKKKVCSKCFHEF